MKTVGRRGAGGSWRCSGRGLFLLKGPPSRVLRSGHPKDRLRFISGCPDHSHAGALDHPIAVLSGMQQHLPHLHCPCAEYSTVQAVPLPPVRPGKSCGISSSVMQRLSPCEQRFRVALKADRPKCRRSGGSSGGCLCLIPCDREPRPGQTVVRGEESYGCLLAS